MGIEKAIKGVVECVNTSGYYARSVAAKLGSR
jgi:hypothetical protein